MTADVQRLTIEIEPSEPIRGRLLDSFGATREFRGWLELSAVIESARAGAAVADKEVRAVGGHDESRPFKAAGSQPKEM
jgi:hypothetical protein